VTSLRIVVFSDEQFGSLCKVVDCGAMSVFYLSAQYTTKIHVAI